MEHRLACYLKTYRKQAHLSQRELTLLLGDVCRTQVSKIERNQRNPSFAVALACEIIFNISAKEIFPGIYAETYELLTNNLLQFQNLIDNEELTDIQQEFLCELAMRLDQA